MNVFMEMQMLLDSVVSNWNKVKYAKYYPKTIE